MMSINALERGLVHTCWMRAWLSNRLADLKAKGKNRKGLAAVLGIAAPQVTMMINGKRRIQTSEIPKIARYLEWPEEVVYAYVTTDNSDLSPNAPPLVKVPLISWVNAGAYAEIYDPYEPGDSHGEVYVAWDRKTLIALTVEGTSMNLVAPKGSTIIVDFADKSLISGEYYVIKYGDGATFKRYRANPDRFEPQSSEPHEIIFPDGPVEVIGRVVMVQNKLNRS